MMPVFVTRKEFADMPYVADALNMRFWSFLMALSGELGMDYKTLRDKATEILKNGEMEQ